MSAIAALAVLVPALRRLARAATPDMPYRTLGRTGEKVSLVGLGGAHLGQQRDEQDSIRIVHAAIDGGINFLDNCWDYHDGESERRMGKALRDGHRNRVFLMTKIDGRTRAAATQQIDESLRRLQTDHVDLMQAHECIRMSDAERIFNDGMIEALLDAKKAGKLRYIGFTGHKSPAIHLAVLEAARKHGFRFDTVQMPLNVMDAHHNSFEKQVLPVLVKEEIGVLGMKPLGGGELLKSNAVTPVECLHYAMSLPVSVVITGCDSQRVLRQALQAARTHDKLRPNERAGLLERTADVAREGKYELYKSSQHFDGTARHPEWLG
ncbi:MAG TPA: aldo/keto reductase [Polyangiales bacterium]|nr:aldo/keto reductase [Polyangiales bacterium]